MNGPFFNGLAKSEPCLITADREVGPGCRRFSAQVDRGVGEACHQSQAVASKLSRSSELIFVHVLFMLVPCLNA